MCVITLPPREGRSTNFLQLTGSCNPIDQLLAFDLLPRFFFVKHPKKQNLLHITPVKRGKGMLFNPSGQNKLENALYEHLPLKW